MRDPALHITRSKLKLVLDKLALKVSDDDMVELFRLAKPYQIRDRYHIETNTKTAKKAQKLVDSENPYVDKFQNLLISIRTELKHQYVQTIRKNDSQYIVLKEVSQSALEFVELFEISTVNKGFEDFIRIGLQLIGKKYAINKFKYHKERIFTAYESLIVIRKDKFKDNTLDVHRYWQEATMQYGGWEKDLTNDTDYVNFVYAREAADEEDADYEDWIQSQFVGLAWLNVIPEVGQLHGEQAKKRYDKYMSAIVETKTDDRLPVKFESSAEEEYYKKINLKK